MTKNTYQGFTRQELMKRISYDPIRGIFTNLKTKGQVTTLNNGRLVIVLRVGSSVVSLTPAKVALFLQEGIVVKKGQAVKFKDGDMTNFIYTNLIVSDKVFEGKDHPYTTPTQYDRINLLHPNMVYVVIRGSEQAVYRTPDYDKAVAILTEWEKDNSIHRWDYTMPDHYLPKGALR